MSIARRVGHGTPTTACRRALALLASAHCMAFRVGVNTIRSYPQAPHLIQSSLLSSLSLRTIISSSLLSPVSIHYWQIFRLETRASKSSSSSSSFAPVSMSAADAAKAAPKLQHLDCSHKFLEYIYIYVYICIDRADIVSGRSTILACCSTVFKPCRVRPSPVGVSRSLTHRQGHAYRQGRNGVA